MALPELVDRLHLDLLRYLLAAAAAAVAAGKTETLTAAAASVDGCHTLIHSAVLQVAGILVHVDSTPAAGWANSDAVASFVSAWPSSAPSETLRVLHHCPHCFVVVAAAVADHHPSS